MQSMPVCRIAPGGSGVHAHDTVFLMQVRLRQLQDMQKMDAKAAER